MTTSNTRDYFVPTSGATITVADDGTVSIEFYLEEAPVDMLEIEDDALGSEIPEDVAKADSETVSDALRRLTTDLTVTIHPTNRKA